MAILKEKQVKKKMLCHEAIMLGISLSGWGYFNKSTWYTTPQKLPDYAQEEQRPLAFDAE